MLPTLGCIRLWPFRWTAALHWAAAGAAEGRSRLLPLSSAYLASFVSLWALPAVPRGQAARDFPYWVGVGSFQPAG
ncbi:hypothetical protein B0J12DRAFT_677105 [Macrophomina phaseolina]|uniref:Uncharacterized protein n=1 Tax=Macrophomina phaseolina TaxID=35725 RepID=A0ABQ8FZA7_9PEZI|nr:hypothetical protein B0J12DRAFT_677105 [Macrophomina phaseolina]